MKHLLRFDKEYTYIKVTPIIGLRNYCNKDLTGNIYRMLMMLSKIEKKIDDKDKFSHIQIHNSTITYIVEGSRNSTTFLFKVPEEISKQFIPKLQEVFKNSLLEVVDYKDSEYKFSKYLAYRNEDPLSIHIDSRQQELINSLLENIDFLEENDGFKITIEMTPVRRIQRLQFKDKTKETEKKIKNGESIKVSRGIREALGNALSNTAVGMINSLLGERKEGSNSPLDLVYLLSNSEEFKRSKSTTNKKTEDLLNTSIRIQCSNRKSLESLLNCFSVLDEDNMLICNKTYTSNVMSVSEVGQLVQIVGNQEIMEKYNIEHIKFKEIKLPTEIKKGTIRIGSSSYKNSNQEIYLSDDGSNKFLAAVYTGATRSGKTTLIQNTVFDAIKAGDSCIFFDFIETCRASNEIIDVLPKDKVTIINLAKCVEGLDFNEIKMDSNIEVKEKYKLLKLKANGILALVDSANLVNDEELKSQMRKILMSAVLITSSQDKTFKDAIQLLQDHKIRREMVKNIPKDMLMFLNDSVENLKILDEKQASNGAIKGTKLHLINSILNRLYALQMNSALEEMLSKDSSKNINLIDEMQKGKFIVIQIPDSIAATNVEKDIICSYYFNRVWFALQQRALTITDKNKKRLLIIIDEIYQLTNTEILVKDRINQISKYHAKFIVSCHSIGQISNLKKELISADASYVLISGSDESCVKDLKERFNKYKPEDLANLKKYHALCSIKTNSSGYVQCITKLPAPVVKK